METCAICLGELRWTGTGRPRIYCGDECKARARKLRSLERCADGWADRGYPSREAHVRGVIERRRVEWRAD